jgi:hypothetical protein
LQAARLGGCFIQIRNVVMRGLDPRIHVFSRLEAKDVDDRIKSGHDEFWQG